MPASFDDMKLIVSWDWKGQPNWAEINNFIAEYGNGLTPIFYPINTGSDQYGAVLSFKSMTEAELLQTVVYPEVVSQ